MAKYEYDEWKKMHVMRVVVCKYNQAKQKIVDVELEPLTMSLAE